MIHLNNFTMVLIVLLMAIIQKILPVCVFQKNHLQTEDASWRVYSEANSKTVRISIERANLLQLLDDYATAQGYEVYIGKVNYSFEKQAIRNLHKVSSPHYNDYFPAIMKVEHYLSLMLLKRAAFKYENEVRIFLVRNSITEKLLKIPCDYKATGLVSNVMLSPYPPVRETSDLAYQVRERINKIESEQIKSVLKNKVGCRIQQSQLYKVYQRVRNVGNI